MFGFLRRKKTQIFFSLCFSFDSALKTIEVQMYVLLVGIFENALTKAISRQKRHFGRFWPLLTFV